MFWRWLLHINPKRGEVYVLDSPLVHSANVRSASRWSYSVEEYDSRKGGWQPTKTVAVEPDSSFNIGWRDRLLVLRRHRDLTLCRALEFRSDCGEHKIVDGPALLWIPTRRLRRARLTHYRDPKELEEIVEEERRQLLAAAEVDQIMRSLPGGGEG